MFTNTTESDYARSRLSTALFTLVLVATSALPIAALLEPTAQAQETVLACSDGQAPHAVAAAHVQASSNS
jgi:hypothetical protein